MHVETSPLEEWIAIVGLRRLAADYEDIDPGLASRALWLAVAIEEECLPASGEPP